MNAEQLLDHARAYRGVVGRIAFLLEQIDAHRKLAKRICHYGRMARKAGLDVTGFAQGVRMHRRVALRYAAERDALAAQHGGRS